MWFFNKKNKKHNYRGRRRGDDQVRGGGTSGTPRSASSSSSSLLTRARSVSPPPPRRTHRQPSPPPIAEALAVAVGVVTPNHHSAGLPRRRNRSQSPPRLANPPPTTTPIHNPSSSPPQRIRVTTVTTQQSRTLATNTTTEEGEDKSSSSLCHPQRQPMHRYYHYWRNKMRALPPRCKFLCLGLWVAWKVVAALLVIYWARPTHPTEAQLSLSSPRQRLRLLYMVTLPSASFWSAAADASTNNHSSSTPSSSQPPWIQSVQNLATVYDVDVALILGDTVQDGEPAQRRRPLLPHSRFLPVLRNDYSGDTSRHRGHLRLHSVWPHATPWRVRDGRLTLANDDNDDDDNDTLALQHRYVAKDALATMLGMAVDRKSGTPGDNNDDEHSYSHYDLFLSWDAQAHVRVTHVATAWEHRHLAAPPAYMAVVPARDWRREGHTNTTTEKEENNTRTFTAKEDDEKNASSSSSSLMWWLSSDWIVREPSSLHVVTGASAEDSYSRRLGGSSGTTTKGDTVWLTASTAVRSLPLHTGWIMTPRQLLQWSTTTTDKNTTNNSTTTRSTRTCPDFLPTPERPPRTCPDWPRWIDAAQWGRHVVAYDTSHYDYTDATATSTRSSLTPRQWWEALWVHENGMAVA